MTPVPDILKMSVRIEQAIFTVLIMDNKKNEKTTTKTTIKQYIMPTSTGKGDVNVNGKTLLKNTYT